MSERNGFANVKSFSKAFKERFSETPASFRRKTRHKTTL